MTTNEIARKNLDLLEEFMKYALEHPEVLDGIPKDAQLVLLPENDNELLTVNTRYLTECKRTGKKVAVFRMELPQRIVPRLQEVS